MNNTIFVLLVILTPLMFGQVAFADNERSAPQQHSQQLYQEVTKSTLLAATQDYVLEAVELPQSRRSTLFANVLDSMAKNATLAKVDDDLKVISRVNFALQFNS